MLRHVRCRAEKVTERGLPVLGYFDAAGAPEAALMVATGQKDTFGNVVMVFCNIDG